MIKQFSHTTVLLTELVDSLLLKPGQVAVDCTAGGGGHTELLLAAVGASGKVIAIDQDDDAIAHLKKRFAPALASGQLIVEKSNFFALKSIIGRHTSAAKVDGICADLGVSSHQLDADERGFSFRKDARLDMRMDATNPNSAYEYINQVEFSELLNVLKDYGEEPKAYFIAQAIIRAREKKSITTTTELADIIRGAVRYKEKSKVDPATRSFQAIRIKVNEELHVLESFLRESPYLLNPGGRVGVISFHSLEDRLVKHQFQRLAGKRDKPTMLRDLPMMEEKTYEWALVKPFPIIPSDEEIALNPRSRSAKLRVLEKI